MAGHITAEPHPEALVAIAACGVVASAVLGGTTNAVNGAVSPTYFVTVLRWHGVEDVWRASIAQGVFEGGLFGLGFSVVFTAGVAAITVGYCTFGFAFKHLLGVLAGAYIAWAM